MNHDARFGAARDAFLAGIAHFEAGRLDDAAERFEASLALMPGRASTLLNLGVTRLRQGRAARALPLLQQLLQLEPDDASAQLQCGICLGTLQRHADAVALFDRVLAQHADEPEALYWRGASLLQIGRSAEALASFERTLALAPGHAPAWTARGHLLRDLGRRDEALAAYREARAHGGDTAMLDFSIAALSGTSPAAGHPRHYVQQLFDEYAPSFEQHLVQTLGYRAHRQLVDGLQGLGPTRWAHALDLGCGTGLCGRELHRVADRVDGADLSGAMVEAARAGGAYTALHQADVVEHLQTTPARHDLVTATDVLIYLGDLAPLLAGVHRATTPGAVFACTFERADGTHDYTLHESLRYAHSARYVREVAAAHGFTLRRLDEAPVREEQRRPIPGLYAYLQRDGR